MSITGSILVFSDEFELLEDGDIPAISAISGTPSIDASFQQIRQQYPQWEIRLYHLPKPAEALEYELRQQEKSKKVYVHPVTGTIIGKNDNANQSFQRQLLLLHYTLFSGTIGKVTVFVVGILFLITLLTGVVVYRKSLIKVVTFNVRFNHKTKRSFYSSLHRIIGVWSLVFNLLMVTTGLWLSSQIALNAIKTRAKKEDVKKQLAPIIRSVDAIVHQLHQQYPDFEIHLIRIRPGSNMVQVSGRLLSDPSYYGEYYSRFTINGTTAAIENSQFMNHMPTGAKLKSMAAPLHFGNYGGIGLKIIYCLFGCTPALLSISGFVLWRKRQHPKTNSKASK